MIRQRGISLLLTLVALVVGTAVAQADQVHQGNIRPVQKLWMSDKPNGDPITIFPSGIKKIYVVFDYKDAADSQIQVRVYDPKGSTIYSETRKYSGAGRENLEVAVSDSLSDGGYITNAFVGMSGQLFLTETEEWNVGKPAPAAPPAQPQPAAPSGQVAGNPAAPNPPAQNANPAAANPVAPLPAAQPPVANAETGLSAPTLIGAGILVVGLLALVVWAVRGFMTAPRVTR